MTSLELAEDTGRAVMSPRVIVINISSNSQEYCLITAAGLLRRGLTPAHGAGGTFRPITARVGQD